MTLGNVRNLARTGLAEADLCIVQIISDGLVTHVLAVAGVFLRKEPD